MSCRDVQDVHYVTMKKGDILLIALLLTLCAVLFALSFADFSTGERYVRVCVDGEEIVRLDLDENTEYTVQNEYGINTIVVSGGEVSISFADCPDETCVRYAPTSRTGESIVCLPHRLSITVVADGEPEVDAVTK